MGSVSLSQEVGSKRIADPVSTPEDAGPNRITNPVSSSKEAGPNSLDKTVSQSALSPEVSSFPDEIGPTLSQGTNTTAYTTPTVCLSQSMSTYLQLVSDDIEIWSHLTLPYAPASKPIHPHYDNIDHTFLE